MSSLPDVDLIAAPDYLGVGTHAVRILRDDGRHAVDRVRVDAGHFFGGDCAMAQEWWILRGEGEMSREGRHFCRQSVRPGDVVHLAAGERGLIRAVTAVVVELRYAFGKGPHDGPFMHV